MKSLLRPQGARTVAAIDLGAETALDIEAVARGAPIDPETSLTAHLSVPPIPLEMANPFLPPTLHGLQGTLGVEIDAKGGLMAPEVSGHFEIEEGAITVVPMGQRLTEVVAKLDLRGREIEVTQMDFKAGEGSGRTRGKVRYSKAGEVEGALKIELAKLPIVSPGAPPSMLDTKVAIALGGGGEVPISVGVDVTGTTFRIIDLKTKGPKPIPGHSGVTYADAKEVKAEEKHAPAKPPPTLDLRLSLSEPVHILGPIVDMKWGGEIRVRTGEQTKIGGALESRSGYIELLGHRFVIEEGEVTLVEGRPFVRITAAAETEEAKVTARIRGDATRPDLVFESDPVLPTDLILTLLVTGRTAPNEEEKESVQQQAAALFASFQSPAIEQALASSLGVDRVRLSFGEGGVESPILSFGKHLTRWLYVEARYTHNAAEEENESELGAELQLSPRWTLETLYGDKAIGSADLFWRVPLK